MLLPVTEEEAPKEGLLIPGKEAALDPTNKADPRSMSDVRAGLYKPLLVVQEDI